MVRSSLMSAMKPKALHTVYFRILINYLQLVVLVTSFQLSWPGLVLELFTV